MSTLINNAGVQHYANKMALAENRKVGSKSLPTALNDIDSLIDEMKTNFDAEYGSPLHMELNNNDTVFSVGTGIEVDKRSEVENSFTDIELSGNTVVNQASNVNTTDIFYKQGTGFSNEQIKTLYDYKLMISTEVVQCASYKLWDVAGLKYGRTYTLIVDVINGTSRSLDWFISSTGYNLNGGFKVLNLESGARQRLVVAFTYTETTRVFAHSLLTAEESTEFVRYSSLMILEGDWTNRPIPRHFEGMKSIGEGTECTQVSISSIGRNICPVSEYSIYDIPIGQNMNGYRDTIICRNIPVKPNTKYAIYVKEIIGAPNQPMRVHTFRDKIPESGLTHVDCYNSPNRIREYTINQNIINGTITTESDAKYINLTTGGFSAESTTITYVDLQVVEGSTIGELEPYKEDKKEISLNEPLRGLPNEVRDTVEKINGEWKIVRRCGEVLIDGMSGNWGTSAITPQENTIIFQGDVVSQLVKPKSLAKSDKFTTYSDATKDEEGILPFSGTNSTRIYFRIKKSKLSSEDVVGFKQWLSENPTKVVYELDTPIMEDISPITLQCWKNGTISIDEVLPVETTHTVALNKPAQIKRNIEELTELRNRVKKLEDTLDIVSLDQALQFQLLNHSINLDK